MAGIAFVCPRPPTVSLGSGTDTQIVMKINGVVFTSYSFFMSVQRPTNGNGSNGGNGSDEPSLSQICLAGTGSGILGSTIACPTELIKIRQQSAPPQLNPSTLSVLRSVLLQDGLKGLYRGFSATALRDIAYGPYFCTYVSPSHHKGRSSLCGIVRYEAVCRFFKSRKTSTVTVTEAVTKTSRTPARRRHGSLIDEAEKELAILTWPELMTAGGLAGLMGWFVSAIQRCKTSLIGWAERHLTTIRSHSPLTCLRLVCRPCPGKGSMGRGNLCLELLWTQSGMKGGGSCSQASDRP